MENLDQAYLNDLVIKAQYGSSNAFAELYAATFQRTYIYAFGYLRDKNLAQDALQETFIRVFRGIGKLQNPSLFIAWLNQIAFHVCYDIHKERIRRKEQPGIPEEVIEIDSRQYYLQQVNNLPVTESQVVIMKYYQDMTLEEIANLLNIRRSTVKRYLKSAKKHIRQLEF